MGESTTMIRLAAAELIDGKALAGFTMAPGAEQPTQTRNPVALALALCEPRVVAVATGVSDLAELRARTTIGPDVDSQDPVIERAWTFLEATQIILDAGDSIRIVEAWWLGMNPYLGDRAPALVLAEGGAAAVKAAAHDFALNG